MIKPMEK